jgi:hypothetical protein
MRTKGINRKEVENRMWEWLEVAAIILGTIAEIGKRIKK